MDSEALRLAALTGVTPLQLAALALTNPTLIQLQLLRTPEAVDHFLAHGGRSRAPADDVAPRVVVTECPSDDEDFIDFNAIPTLYRLAAPRQPVFQWLPAPCGYAAEYRLGDVAGCGRGNTKREAKGRAAMSLTRTLHALSPAAQKA